MSEMKNLVWQNEELVNVARAAFREADIDGSGSLEESVML